MRKMQGGFTLVEVSLFLAVTALIFVGVAIGTQNSIFQQRYNDAVQTFAEFLRTEYSKVENVQSDGGGNSDYVVYGRLITFGQEKDLNGKDNNNGAVFSYSIVAEASNEMGDGSILEQLKNAKYNVGFDDGNGGFRLAGYADSYVPRWGSRIQTTAGWNGSEYIPFVGAIMIVRHPESGTIYTLVEDNTVIEINGVSTNPGERLRGIGFGFGEIDMCVNPNGVEKSNLRKDIRIVANARNASGIEVLDGNGECE